MLNYLNKVYNKIKNSKNSKNSFKIVKSNKILPTPYIYMFGLFIVSMLLLVSATSIADDTGDSKLYTDNNDVIFNLTAIPHRINDTHAYISLNLQSDKKTNKIFKINNDQSITLSDNTSNTINTSPIDINGIINGDTINKHLNISDDGNDTILDVKFNNIELNPLNEIQPYNNSFIIMDNSSKIQDIIDINASENDTIILKEGNYYESNITVNKAGLTIKADEGLTPEDVIVNAQGKGRVFRVTKDNVNIINLTIKNGKDLSGGGVYTNDNGSVVSCSIINNTAINNLGGGVYGSGSVVNCSIINNTAYDGGGVYIPYGSVVNCSIINNTATNNGGGVRSSSGSSVVNCSIINNTANNDGGGVYIPYGSSMVNCSIINNTASNGGGVYINSGGKVNYCRILNNKASNGKEANNNGNINYNWWGQNNITDLIVGQLPMNYYVVQLGVGENKTTVNNSYNNCSFPVYLSYGLVLNTTNLSTNVSNLPDFDKKLRLGNLTNSFTTPLKESILKPNSLLGILINGLDLPFNRFDIPIVDNSNAKLSYSITLNDNGSYVFEALVDNEDLNINLSAPKLPTKIEFVNESVNHENKTLTINGTATYNNSGDIHPLGDAVLNVSIDGVDYPTVTTNSSGIFNYNSPPVVPGNHTILISFSGNESFEPSNDSYSFDVNKTNINFNNLNTTVNPDHSVIITGNIVDDSNNNLSGVNVSLETMSNNVIGSNITDGNGGFILNIHGLSHGNYSYRLNATENDTHNGEITDIIFTIPKYDTNLTLSTPQIIYGDSAVFTANLNSSNGEAINNKTIDFYVDGDIVGSNQTNIGGIAILNNYTPPSVGTYVVNASFIGDENYSNSNITSTLTVVPHPKYDLSLRNDPAGSVVIGTWIHSIATAIDGEPLPDDYCRFKITALSNNVQWFDKCMFGVNDWADCRWQLTEKGSYFVEVWAYDKYNNNVHVPVNFKANNLFLRSVFNDNAGEVTASQTIIVK
ncbi:MAG: Ig-like domain repeat protein [Methanobrevibacter sp.]|jgi:hypothetical protein|nr:Ig-like domain repeat protein [Candidatus Methanovirga meridionalis]